MHSNSHFAQHGRLLDIHLLSEIRQFYSFPRTAPRASHQNLATRFPRPPSGKSEFLRHRPNMMATTSTHSAQLAHYPSCSQSARSHARKHFDTIAPRSECDIRPSHHSSTSTTTSIHYTSNSTRTKLSIPSCWPWHCRIGMGKSMVESA